MYRGSKETQDYANFVSLAQELQGIEFAYTDTAEYIVGRAELPRDRLAIHHTVNTTDSVIFNGKTYQQMRGFIIKEVFRGVVIETPKIFDMVKDHQFPALRVLCEGAESCQPVIEMLKNSENHYGHYLIKMYKVLSKREYAHSGVETDVLPPKITILDSRRGHIHEHIYTREITREGLENFIENYFEQRKHPHHYSEHPNEHYQKIAKSITGHNYNREILKTKKGIVLLIHNGKPEEQSLISSFETVAEWFHSKKIHRYVKFRILNQRENLTPLPFYKGPVLLMIRQHTQYEPSRHRVHHIKGTKITRKGVYHLLQHHGSYSLDEISSQSHSSTSSHGDPHILEEPEQDL